jgi:predicted ATPase
MPDTFVLGRRQFDSFLRGRMRTNRVVVPARQSHHAPGDTVRVSLGQDGPARSGRVTRWHVQDADRHEPDIVTVGFAAAPVRLIHRRKFIITGGPGFGKTSIVEGLAKSGFATVPEAAIEVIRENIDTDQSVMPWADRLAFDRLVIGKLKRSYESVKPGQLAFFDRGFPDLIGWRRFSGLRFTDVSREITLHPYERRFFFVPAWPEIYRTTDERPYSLDEAIRAGDLLLESYRRLRYDPIVVPTGSVGRRVEFVLDTLASIS